MLKRIICFIVLTSFVLSITGAGISVSSNGVSASLSVSAGYNEHGPLWISGVKY